MQVRLRTWHGLGRRVYLRTDTVIYITIFERWYDKTLRLYF